MSIVDIAKTIKTEPQQLRVRFGVVTAIDTPTSTISVQVAGSTDSISNIRRLASMSPSVSVACVLLTDGVDLFAIGHIA